MPDLNAIIDAWLTVGNLAKFRVRGFRLREAEDNCGRIMPGDEINGRMLSNDTAAVGYIVFHDGLNVPIARDSDNCEMVLHIVLCCQLL
ncbi:hypothetical protein BM1_00742 [Bipolaris maydis]|nr:hypothetical protein BM1_00742 [Bipolaris maydis]